jgi:hypothetical protein
MEKRVNRGWRYLTPVERIMLQAPSKGLTSGVASIRLVLVTVIFALAPAGASAYSTAALTAKDVQKAERIIAKLHRLEEVTATAVDFRAYKAESTGLFPGLFVDASELQEGNLKTDLTTAVFLYERAYRAGFDPGARATDCEGEVREIYLKLCRESRDGNPTRLLWSKARLHTGWATAVVRSYRGATDTETLTELSRLEAERKRDILLAKHALAALRRLAGVVETYSTGDALEEAVRVKRVSFEQLSREISESLMAVEQVLASLPRGRLYVLLDNARGSYRDGLFWWGKVYRMREMTVSVNNLAAPDPLRLIGLSPGTVTGTVLANWRSALRYAREAEIVTSALKP